MEEEKWNDNWENQSNEKKILVSGDKGTCNVWSNMVWSKLKCFDSSEFFFILDNSHPLKQLWISGPHTLGKGW